MPTGVSPPCVLTRTEYRAALRADHGTPRRYLSGCRCDRCSTPGNHRFAQAERAKLYPQPRG